MLGSWITKGGIMEIELIVQIGILGCLLYIIFFLRDFLKAYDVVQTGRWNSLEQHLEVIKDKD